MKKAEVTNDEIMAMLSKFADRVDERFDGVDERFDKVEADVAELKADVTGLKTDVDRICGILDAHMSRIEQIMQKNAVQTHQYDRMQRWIFQLADQANVRLKYE